jgi:5-hydroxyisourate hydrolase-like protein (transthyretin family)
MNRIILCIIVCIIVISNTYANNQPDKKITVKVLDLKTRTPIENANVSIDVLKANATDIITKKGLTDVNGQCIFTVGTGMDMGYTITARKDGYYNCFTRDPNNPLVSSKSFVSIIDDKVTLYLTADVDHLRKYYYSITPHIQIDTLINQLKNDRFSPSTFFYLPELNWEDVPKLLKIANDTTKITKFTQNPYSSIKQEECYLGVFALWLIESIRISEGKPLLEPVKRFPSLNPIIIEKTKGESIFSMFLITHDMIQNAYEAYANWWESAKAMDHGEACKFNPLEKTGLKW